jgi:nitric oxide reductase large subunit
MCFYLLHKNWRARLAMNSSASWIFTCWLCAGFSALASMGGYAAKTTSGLGSLAMFALSLFLVIFSYAFLAEAKRIHHIRILARNAVFDDETQSNTSPL